MMRLKPQRFDERLPAVMSDLGMIRYLGYAELPAAQALARRLEAEQGEEIKNGVHLIVVRSADNSLVVGDFHHYAATPDPFAPAAVDDLILDEYARVFEGDAPPVAGALDGNLRFGEGSARARRQAVGGAAHRIDHQRHGRQYLLRARRGGRG